MYFSVEKMLLALTLLPSFHHSEAHVGCARCCPELWSQLVLLWAVLVSLYSVAVFLGSAVASLCLLLSGALRLVMPSAGAQQKLASVSLRLRARWLINQPWLLPWPVWVLRPPLQPGGLLGSVLQCLGLRQRPACPAGSPSL